MKSFYWPLLLSLVLGRTCLVAGDKNASSDGKQVIKICEEDEYCEDDEDSGEGEVGIDDLIDPVGAFNELITADYKCGDNYVEAVKKALKRVPDSHKRFCLSTAPEIFEALKNGKDDGRVEISKTASWNDSALLLTIGWAIAESGWKSKRKCLWGFACSAKTMNEGVQSLVQYLYGPKNNGCAPHRALTKNFEDKNISKIWSDDRLNLLLRSSGYAGRASAFYNDRLPGEIITSATARSVSEVESPCTYNEVRSNYGGYVISATKSALKYCSLVAEGYGVGGITCDSNMSKKNKGSRGSKSFCSEGEPYATWRKKFFQFLQNTEFAFTEAKAAHIIGPGAGKIKR